MGYQWDCVSILFYYFYKERIIFYKGTINLFKKKKKSKNLILNYNFFFYSQINLIFCFVDGNLFNFYFIKVSNSFLFLS